jgi:hypothetical protein
MPVGFFDLNTDDRTGLAAAAEKAGGFSSDLGKIMAGILFFIIKNGRHLLNSPRHISRETCAKSGQAWVYDMY